jgi:hypothetical protein
MAIQWRGKFGLHSPDKKTLTLDVRVIHKVTLSLPSLSSIIPSVFIPSLSGIRKRNDILLNLSMKLSI